MSEIDSIKISNTSFQLTPQNISNIKKHLHECEPVIDQLILEKITLELGIPIDAFSNTYDAYCLIYMYTHNEIPKFELTKNPIEFRNKFFLNTSYKNEHSRIKLYYFNKEYDNINITIKSHNIENNIHVIEIDTSKCVCHCIIEVRTLDLSNNNIEQIARFICNQYKPIQDTIYRACMQVDTHSTKIGDNAPWIGMSLIMDSLDIIPIQIISGDIGCGLSVYPLMTISNQLNMKDFEGGEGILDNVSKLQIVFNASCRSGLMRGKKVEEGTIVSNLFSKCNIFHADMEGIIPFIEFGERLTELLNDLSFKIPNYDDKYDIIIDQKKLSKNVSNALNFCFGHLCSLGSSGNHFAELGSDINGDIYTIIHSGSRGIGSKIYDAINFLCHFNTGSGLATNKMSFLYTEAYTILETIAFYNRFMCIVAIYEKMNLYMDKFMNIPISTDTNTLKTGIINCEMLKNVDQNIRHSLIKGMVHNGLSAFVDHEQKEIICILKKGSIAMSEGCGIGFVALSAGIGCVSFIRNNPDIRYREIPVDKAKYLLQNGYKLVHDQDYIKKNVGLYGHGAGRSRSTTESNKIINHVDVVKHAHENGYLINIGSGTYGDGPSAYKNIDLSIYDDSRNKIRMIKTICSYKECIVNHYNTDSIEKFARSVIDTYDNLDNDNLETKINIINILSLDLILLKNYFDTQHKKIQFFNKETKEKYYKMCEIQTKLFIKYFIFEYVNSSLIHNS